MVSLNPSSTDPVSSWFSLHLSHGRAALCIKIWLCPSHFTLINHQSPAMRIWFHFTSREHQCTRDWNGQSSGQHLMPKKDLMKRDPEVRRTRVSRSGLRWWMMRRGEAFQPAPKYISSMFLVQTSILSTWHCYLSNSGSAEGSLCIPLDFTRSLFYRPGFVYPPRASWPKILFAFSRFHPRARIHSSCCNKAQKHQIKNKQRPRNKQGNTQNTRRVTTGFTPRTGSPWEQRDTQNVKAAQHMNFCILQMHRTYMWPS